MVRGVRPTFRVLLSACLSGLVLIGLDHLHCDGITVGLILVALIYSFGFYWGWPAALATLAAATFGLDYFFLTPRGFAIIGLQQWLTFSVFLAVALTTCRIAAGSKRQRRDAERLRTEMFDLAKIGAVLAQCRSQDEILEHLDLLRETLHTESFTIYESGVGVISQTGKNAGLVTQARLSDVATSGVSFRDPACSITPMLSGDESWGSIATAGGLSSPEMLRAAASLLANAIVAARLAESERAAEEVRHCEELKSQTRDEVVHEIRGPLHCIGLAASTLLSSRPGNPVQQRQLLHAIGEELERVDRTIGKKVQQKQPVSYPTQGSPAAYGIEDLILPAREALESDISARLVTNIPANLPCVFCDRDRARRVFDLLLENALTHSGPNASIDVSAELDEDMGMVVIKIANSQWLSPLTGPAFETARQLIESQGGEIWVADTARRAAAICFSLLPANREVA